MSKSLLFLPDISGYTKFVQNTEVQHSQQVIAELLEILVEANTQDLKLAEIEGDALFFYKEEIPSREKILAQVETMFSAFYSHLSLLKKNRICPCNACSTAPELQLKIIAHSGDIEFISVQNSSKPFGSAVIQAHRLMKNSVDSDNYFLITQELANEVELCDQYKSKLFEFIKGKDQYDGSELNYFYAIIDKNNLKLSPFRRGENVKINRSPDVLIKRTFNISAEHLIEYITNYNYRHYWVEGVDKFEFNENEVTRVGSEHVCVINGKHFNFKTIIKDGKAGQLIYGEQTDGPSVVDGIMQFFVITPDGPNSSTLESEIYISAKSIHKKLIFPLVKKTINKNIGKSIEKLFEFTETNASKELIA